jgi:hypothetical protein
MSGSGAFLEKLLFLCLLRNVGESYTLYGGEKNFAFVANLVDPAGFCFFGKDTINVPVLSISGINGLFGSGGLVGV